MRRRLCAPWPVLLLVLGCAGAATQQVGYTPIDAPAAQPVAPRLVVEPFTDGRPPPVDPQPAWLGYSVGRWEGDTFVVESSGFNDKAWLDAGGTPHSEALSTVERLRRLDFGHMEAEFTFDDPRAFTSRWSAKARFELLPDTDLLEHHCDNQKWTGKAP